MTDKKAPAEKKAEKIVVVKDTQNGVTRPSAGTKTGLVWELADKISAKLKQPAGRGAVIKAATDKEINPSTAATQYGRWRKYNGLTGTGREETKETKAAPAKKEAPAKKAAPAKK